MRANCQALSEIVIDIHNSNDDAKPLSSQFLSVSIATKNVLFFTHSDAFFSCIYAQDLKTISGLLNFKHDCTQVHFQEHCIFSHLYNITFLPVQSALIIFHFHIQAVDLSSGSCSVQTCSDEQDLFCPFFIFLFFSLGEERGGGGIINQNVDKPIQGQVLANYYL